MWDQWFAWRPVKTSKGVVWFEWVWRLRRDHVTRYFPRTWVDGDTTPPHPLLAPDIDAAGRPSRGPATPV